MIVFEILPNNIIISFCVIIITVLTSNIECATNTHKTISNKRSCFIRNHVKSHFKLTEHQFKSLLKES